MERIVSTDDLEVKSNFNPDGIVIEVKIKDHVVFPELDADNKGKMSRFAKIIFDHFTNELSRSLFHKDGKMKDEKTIKIACGKCGEIFETKPGCCGNKETIRECPHCGTPNKI